MTKPLPKWVMQRYSVLWNKFTDHEFNRKNALQTLNHDKMISLALSELGRSGWLETKLDPSDGRKRIYRLKSPNQAIREMSTGE